MVAVWTQTLLSAAEISNFFSALGVVICFLSMVVFILRVKGVNLGGSSVVYVKEPSPVQVSYKKIGIPFTCLLGKTKSNELQFKVTLEVPCYFQALWSVPAAQLKEFLYMPWHIFSEKMEDINYFEAEKVEDKRFLEPDGANEPYTIVIEKDTNLSPLGNAPRSHFPLVVVLMKTEVSCHEDANVGALISIIHISDEDCPMPTSIMYQYLKQYSGQLTQLQTLFTQRTELNLNERKRMEDLNLNSSFTNPYENEASEDGTCVICRVMPPTRALLPCRHVCICSYCFSRLDACPLCRTRISAFFLTDAGEEQRQAEMRAEERNRNESNLERHRSFLNNMNNVLNSFLGIRENE